MNIFVALMIPFLGTSLGAACVFFLKDRLNPLVQKALLGFASGVMVAASVWSLLIPAMEMSEELGKLSFLPAAVGFSLGILFLLVMDRIIPHLHLNEEKPEGMPSKLKKQPCWYLLSPFTIFRREWRSAWCLRGCLRETTKLQCLGRWR